MGVIDLRKDCYWNVHTIIATNSISFTVFIAAIMYLVDQFVFLLYLKSRT